MRQILTLELTIDLLGLATAQTRSNELSRPPPSRTFSNIQDLRHMMDRSQGRSCREFLHSGTRVFQVLLLCHLPGTVQGHAHSHCGHRHGDGIDASALRLHLHLAGDLPLWTEWIWSTLCLMQAFMQQHKIHYLIYRWIIHWLWVHLRQGEGKMSWEIATIYCFSKEFDYLLKYFMQIFQKSFAGL